MLGGQKMVMMKQEGNTKTLPSLQYLVYLIEINAVNDFLKQPRNSYPIWDFMTDLTVHHAQGKT